MIRNRVRRRIREAMRVRYPGLPAGWDVLVIARPAARDVPFPELAATLDGLLRRCGVASA